MNALITVLVGIIAAAAVSIAVMLFVQMPPAQSPWEKTAAELDTALQVLGATARPAKVWDKQTGQWKKAD